MTRLTWNSIGSREFEAGVDRGVLFVDGVGVSWQGLIAVAESVSGGDVQPYFIDGVNYLNEPSRQAFAATIEAYTYPEEFSECDGTAEMNNGLFATNQSKKTFSLCYRTMIGNDLEGTNLGYKIHIVYNASASPTSRANDTFTNEVDPFNFSWDILAKPPEVAGVAPTAHFVIDSRKTPSDLLGDIEDILYGTPSTNPRLPSLSELLFIFSSYQASILDAGTLSDTYFSTFDSGTLAESQTSTIDGGSP